MKIRIFSDIHNEFGKFIIPPMPDDKDTVLVLAGDVDAGNHVPRLVEYLKECSTMFRHVIFVPGNHEYYHGVMETVFNDLLFGCSLQTNIHIMDCSDICIDDTYFIGATLWTDFENGNPMAMEYARRNMTDFEIIHVEDEHARYGSRVVTPYDVLILHNLSKDYIFKRINYRKDICDKIVVVSHHCPSYQSVPDIFKGNRLNGAFASSLDYDILNTEPDVWIHGHTHTSFDYQIGKTRVICNPRGYHGYELNKGFNPLLTVEI